MVFHGDHVWKNEFETEGDYEETKKWLTLGERWGAVFCVIAGGNNDATSMFNSMSYSHIATLGALTHVMYKLSIHSARPSSVLFFSSPKTLITSSGGSVRLFS
jgi:hypothetical protein